MSADVVATLARLIAQRTNNPTGDEPACARLLHGELARFAPDKLELIEVPHRERIGACVLATWGTPRLLVNAHLDTVPPNAGWSGDPFVARVDEERVMGLGAADTKGAIAAILCALETARPVDTAILFSGDEELDNSCMRALIARGTVRGAERAIVCEPTSLRAGVRHRGICSLEVELTGPGGHSSFADTLPRPLAQLARVAVALDDWGIAQRTAGPPGFLGMCLNVAKLDGGVAFNVIAARALLSASLRPPPGSDIAAVQAALSAIVVGIAADAHVHWRMANPPFATRDLAAFSSLRGRETVDLGFWTEAALLSATGIDAVVIGPGDIAQAHSPDEWVAVTQLREAERFFVQVFEARGSG